MTDKKIFLKYLKKLASEGGEARAKRLTKEERTAIARKGAKARWAKKKAS